MGKQIKTNFSWEKFFLELIEKPLLKKHFEIKRAHFQDSDIKDYVYSKMSFTVEMFFSVFSPIIFSVFFLGVFLNVFPSVFMSVFTFLVVSFHCLGNL